MNRLQVIPELFPAELLSKLLEGIEIKTDNDRLHEVRVNTIISIANRCLILILTLMSYVGVYLPILTDVFLDQRREQSY